MRRTNSVEKSMSDFQFLTSRIEKIAFENTVLHIDEDCQKVIDLNFGDVDSLENDEEMTGKITLNVIVEVQKNNEKVVSINYVITGFFKDKKNCDKESFERMLKINGLATLYSLARAHITTISSLAGIQPLTIPMINVYNYVLQKENKKKAEDE